jgi:hypothetical protein
MAYLGMRLGFILALCIFPWLCLTGDTFGRDLTFEDRVKAQEAIERIYCSHQSRAMKAFMDVVQDSDLVAFPGLPGRFKA